MADLLRQSGLARVVITGGEPFLRSDLPEIVNGFARRSFSTTLLTNGTLATRESLMKLYDLGLNDIGISLDTLDPQKQAQICGNDDVWHRAVRTIRESVDIFSRGIVEVLITVSADNLHEIPELVSFIENDLGAWAVVNPINIPAGEHAFLSAPKHHSLPLPAEQVDHIYNMLITMKQQRHRLLVSEKFLEDSRSYLKTGDYRWKCDAGQRYFTVFSDGALAPCSDTPAIANIMDMTPGDFRQHSFITKTQDIRASCGGCIFSCWREASYLFTEPTVWKERILTSLHLVASKRK